MHGDRELKNLSIIQTIKTSPNTPTRKTKDSADWAHTTATLPPYFEDLSSSVLIGGFERTTVHIARLLIYSHHVPAEDFHKSVRRILSQAPLRCDWQIILARNWIGNVSYTLWE